MGSGTFEKSLSGTYEVPSGAAIAEKVHQLSLRQVPAQQLPGRLPSSSQTNGVLRLSVTPLKFPIMHVPSCIVLCLTFRRKKPAWATTGPADSKESPADADLHGPQHVDAASDDKSHPVDQKPAITVGASAVSLVRGAFNAALSAVTPKAAEPADEVPEHSEHADNDSHSQEAPDSAATRAEVAASVDGSEHGASSIGTAAGDKLVPDAPAEHGEPGENRAAHSSSASRAQQQPDHDKTAHHLATNKATTSRNSAVAQDQLATKMAKARQLSIQKHVLQHNMFQANSIEATHTVHSPDAVPESFQEPTLAAILRESAVADELARRHAQQAAKAGDTAPPFVTTSASPQSTSRHHSRPNSRPISAAGTMTQAQNLEAGVHAASLRSALGDATPLSSPRQQGRKAKGQGPRSKAGSFRGTYTPDFTSRLGSTSSSLQVSNA